MMVVMMYVSVKANKKPAARQMPKKPVRAHEGIRQVGPKRGTLKKGFRYTGMIAANGLPEIKKVTSK